MSALIKYAIQQVKSPTNPQRRAQTGRLRDTELEVVSVYDPGEDRYAVHAYVTTADGARHKLPMVDNFADDERAGFAKGWEQIEVFFAS